MKAVVRGLAVGDDEVGTLSVGVPLTTLASCCVQKLKELQAERHDKDVKLRVEVEGGGCSGFQYKFRLDSSSAAPDDM